jgi:hypothetical protein
LASIASVVFMIFAKPLPLWKISSCSRSSSPRRLRRDHRDRLGDVLFGVGELAGAGRRRGQRAGPDRVVGEPGLRHGFVRQAGDDVPPGGAGGPLDQLQAHVAVERLDDERAVEVVDRRVEVVGRVVRLGQQREHADVAWVVAGERGQLPDGGGGVGAGLAAELDHRAVVAGVAVRVALGEPLLHEPFGLGELARAEQEVDLKVGQLERPGVGRDGLGDDLLGLGHLVGRQQQLHALADDRRPGQAFEQLDGLLGRFVRASSWASSCRRGGTSPPGRAMACRSVSSAIAGLLARA